MSSGDIVVSGTLTQLKSVISNTINISVKDELSIGKAKADAAKGEAYTLDGKKLTGHTSKGIFIRDGRKYMRH